MIVERETAVKYGLEQVNVMPQPKAGGSFATTAWRHFSSPVAVEEVKAACGIDIGGTLIGMHLKRLQFRSGCQFKNRRSKYSLRAHPTEIYRRHSCRI